MTVINSVTLIPVGPTCELENICDTLESVRHFITTPNVILVLDDSGKETGLAVKARFPEVVILPAERNYGKQAGLYLNLSRGLAYAHANHSFEVLLRIDTDALVIGPDPQIDAARYFQRHPEYGILGSHRVDCNGEPRNFDWCREQVRKEIARSGFEEDPDGRREGWTFLHQVLRQARENGYEYGEHCMGGAYFMSRECVARLSKNHLLSRDEIRGSKLEEDMIFGILIHAVGLRHGDFATGQHPMGVRWKGLPCAPEELLRRGKKITHSTRFFEDQTEPEIRAFFRAAREHDSTHCGEP